MTCITHVLCSLAMVFSEYSERSIIGCLDWSNTSEANFRVAFRPFLLFMGLRLELYVCKDGVTIVLALLNIRSVRLRKREKGGSYLSRRKDIALF